MVLPHHGATVKRGLQFICGATVDQTQVQGSARMCRRPSSALRTCSRSFEQQRQECQVDELQAGVELALAVLP